MCQQEPVKILQVFAMQMLMTARLIEISVPTPFSIVALIIQAASSDVGFFCLQKLAQNASHFRFAAHIRSSPSGT